MTQQDILDLKVISNIPARYASAKFEGITDEQDILVDKLRANWNKGRETSVNDFIIFGSIGNGKTHIVIGLLNRLIQKGLHCKYITEFQLLEIYHRKEYKEFDKFARAKLLVIDEIGKRNLAEWQQIQLEELISARYDNQLPTIFITNLTQEEFKKTIGDRAADRLRDNNVQKFTLRGESLRGREKARA